jgi:hypothetical protein
MDPDTINTLLVITVLLHAGTFFFLQHVASHFKEYISPLEGVMLSAVMGSDASVATAAYGADGGLAGPHTYEERGAGAHPADANGIALGVTQAGAVYQNRGGSRDGRGGVIANYHALHETLDVSVFR